MAELIRGYDWAGTALGPSDRWSPALRAAVDMMLVSPMIAGLAVGADRLFLYNDEAARRYGNRHPEALGRPLGQVFAHEFRRVAGFYDQVFAGENVFVPAQELDPAENGDPQIDEAYLTPIRNEKGLVEAALMTGYSVAKQRLTERALLESEARLSSELKATELLRELAERLVTEESSRTFYNEILSAAVSITHSDAGTVQIYESDTRSLVLLATFGFDDGMKRHFARVDAGSCTACGEALRTNRRAFVDFRDGGDDAAHRHIAAGYRTAQATPLLARDGRPLGMLNTHWHAADYRPTDAELRLLDILARQAADMVEAREAREVLRQRDTQLTLALEIGEIGHWTYDLTSGELTSSEHCRANFGRDPDLPFTYDDLVAAIHPDDVGQQQRAVDEAAANRSQFEVEYRVITPAGGMRWVHVQGRFADGSKPRLVGVSRDVTSRREAEERHSLLLKLADALHSASDPETVISAACVVLGEHLDATQIVFAEIDEKAGMASIRTGWSANGAVAGPEILRLTDFDGPLLNNLRAGRSIKFDDVGRPPYDRGDLAALAAIGVRAGISVPLLVGGRFILNINVHQDQPRVWTDAEVALVEEVAERLWAAVERARAEEARRASEDLLRQFGGASQDVLWIRDAQTLQWKYLTPAFEKTYGLSCDAALAGENYGNWIDLILPEDRDEAMANIERVRRGEHAVFEFRIRRASDGAVRWMRNTDFPIRNAAGKVVLIGGIGSDISAIKQAIERQDLLLAELQHRVRNILGMIRAMVRQSAEGHEDLDDYLAHLVGRLDAMGRTQILLTRIADARVDLESLVHDELTAHFAKEEFVHVEGPRAQLSSKAAEVLTLAIHELATNSVKYGALGRDGKLSVTWDCHHREDVLWLELIWRETGVGLAEREAHEGFGTELIQERVPYEMRGEASIDRAGGQVLVHIAFPLTDGTSIFETGPADGVGNA